MAIIKNLIIHRWPIREIHGWLASRVGMKGSISIAAESEKQFGYRQHGM
jgi:hypothetical protein